MVSRSCTVSFIAKLRILLECLSSLPTCSFSAARHLNEMLDPLRPTTMFHAAENQGSWTKRGFSTGIVSRWPSAKHSSRKTAQLSAELFNPKALQHRQAALTVPFHHNPQHAKMRTNSEKHEPRLRRTSQLQANIGPSVVWLVPLMKQREYPLIFEPLPRSCCSCSSHWPQHRWSETGIEGVADVLEVTRMHQMQLPLSHDLNRYKKETDTTMKFLMSRHSSGSIPLAPVHAAPEVPGPRAPFWIQFSKPESLYSALLGFDEITTYPYKLHYTKIQFAVLVLRSFSRSGWKQLRL